MKYNCNECMKNFNDPPQSDDWAHCPRCGAYDTEPDTSEPYTVIDGEREYHNATD